MGTPTIDNQMTGASNGAVTVAALEAAINHWRALRPSQGEEGALSPEVDILAEVYADMIMRHAAATDIASLSAAQRALLLGPGTPA